MDDRPHITDAPGLIWRKLVNGWACKWQARTDLASRGFQPRSRSLWSGEGEPDADALDFILQQCNILQNEMLTWGRGGVPVMLPFDGSLRGLIASYQTDGDSTYRKLRYRTRLNYDNLCKRIDREHGMEAVADIKARNVLRWHEEWSKDGHITHAHSLITMLRTLISFGATILEDKDCERLMAVMHRMRFRGPGVRKSVLLAEHVVAIRTKAHELGMHSIALAQAIQFELMLRQKDVIGEWVPFEELGASDVKDTALGMKWLRGLRWSEINENLILRHTTSKRNKELVVDLRNAAMVMEELNRLPSRRSSGPVIVNEITELPWQGLHFRRAWRKVADACGIPKDVWNMDSRAGAISEGRKAGASLESLRHAATHSDIATTQGYDRDEGETTAEVLKLRVAKRTKRE